MRDFEEFNTSRVPDTALLVLPSRSRVIDLEIVDGGGGGGFGPGGGGVTAPVGDIATTKLSTQKR